MADLAAERETHVMFGSGGGEREVSARFVTRNYFDLLGVRMEHGRGVSLRG